MAAGSTYTPIATTTLGSAAASYTFSSIPSTYTDLILVANTGFTDGAGDNQFEVRVGNGSIDTGANYSTTSLVGTGSTAFSYRQSGSNWFETGRISRSGLTSTIIVHFQNYANTSTYKTFLAEAKDAGSSYNVGAYVSAGLWRSTSAINTISVSNFYASNTLVTGSTFTLYGIAAA